MNQLCRNISLWATPVRECPRANLDKGAEECLRAPRSLNAVHTKDDGHTHTHTHTHTHDDEVECVLAQNYLTHQTSTTESVFFKQSELLVLRSEYHMQYVNQKNGTRPLSKNIEHTDFTQRV